jgi:hypothetical protein
MTDQETTSDRRKHERISVEFPLSYKIGRKTLGGSTVNVCNEGILVESFLSSKTALKIFKTLKKQPSYRLEVEFSYEGNTDLRDVEIKHFHLEFIGSEAYRFTVGFYLPKPK